MSANVTEAASARADPEVAAHPAIGRFSLLEKIGAGSMGEVWKANDPRIGRTVAVKLLRVPDGLDPARREEWERRFLLEARAAGRLAHPGIVAVHDVGQANDGRPFIVMEYIEGRSLDAYLKRGVRPDPARVLDWAAQVADALDHAHRQGIVHRDVKPANILMDGAGRVRLADFGIARLGDSDLTREGAFLGSPAYAAPEQIRGGAVDGRADLFSLGAVTYALLTGARPFDGADLPSIAYAICHVEPTPPRRLRPELTAAMQAVVMKALSKDPAHRHRWGQEMAEDLRAAAASATAPAKNGGRLEKTVVERTAVDRAARPAEGTAPDSAVAIEHRAAAWGSAAAVGVVRAAAAIAGGSKRAGTRAAAWSAVWAPRIAEAARRAVVASAASCREANSPRLLAAAGLLLAVGALGGAIWFRSSGRTPDVEAAPSAAARVRSFIHESVLRENIGMRVEHGLGDGRLTVWSDGSEVKSRALSARKKKVAIAGRSLMSYGRETDEDSLRLPPGPHELSVRVTSGDGRLDLVRRLSVEVAAGERYALDVSVRSWPRPKLDLEWRRAVQKEAS
ncbi:MAG: serine/threonine protein kinase [Acidobacteriia bacterium]|nr:serine/threonine protein kinase [Terriglobia bacterium]